MFSFCAQFPISAIDGNYLDQLFESPFEKNYTKERFHSFVSETY